MFWKKQKTSKKILLDFESSNQRDAFRYKHGNKDGPEIIFLGKQFNLLDISASGTSFKSKDFSEGDSDYVNLDLNDPETRELPLIPLKIKILSKDKDTDICHCCFEGITEEQEDLIHQYILDKQKASIKKKKNHDPSY